jgi:hypothetical protein
MFTSLDALSLYNQTISSMNDSANSQYNSTLSQINYIQAHSMDPSDMGAYNLTMYGMNAIHGIQSMIVNNVSNIPNLAAQALTGSTNVTGTGSVAASPAPAAIVNSPNLNPIATVTTAIGNIAPAHNLLTAVLLVVIGISIGALIFNR